MAQRERISSAIAGDRDALEKRSRHFPSVSIGAGAVGAQSVAALALAAVAVGALAIGALAIGRVVIGRARVRRLEIDELVVRRLRVLEQLQSPSDRRSEGQP